MNPVRTSWCARISFPTETTRFADVVLPVRRPGVKTRGPLQTAERRVSHGSESTRPSPEHIKAQLDGSSRTDCKARFGQEWNSEQLAKEIWDHEISPIFARNSAGLKYSRIEERWHSVALSGRKTIQGPKILHHEWRSSPIPMEMDVLMPLLNGLRQRRCLTRNIPFVLSTGRSVCTTITPAPRPVVVKG